MNRNSSINEEIDRTLRGFFHAQMPQAWPASPSETEAVRPNAVPSRRAPARLTLAASIGLLLGLGTTLSYAPQSPTAPAGSGLLNDASADGKKLEKHIFPDHQPTLPDTGK